MYTQEASQKKIMYNNGYEILEEGKISHEN